MPLTIVVENTDNSGLSEEILRSLSPHFDEGVFIGVALNRSDLFARLRGPEVVGAIVADDDSRSVESLRVIHPATRLVVLTNEVKLPADGLSLIVPTGAWKDQVPQIARFLQGLKATQDPA